MAGVTVQRQHAGVAVPDPAALLAALHAEGHRPLRWGNAPGDTYAPHRHPYRKLLCCLSGSIVFHTSEGDVDLRPGDRMWLEPGTDHAATVGPAGVECAEVHLR